MVEASMTRHRSELSDEEILRALRPPSRDERRDGASSPRRCAASGALSERARAARARRDPSVGLDLLRHHLNEENAEQILDEASRKTNRQIAELLARRAPRPDVPSGIRELPPEAPLLPQQAPIPAPASQGSKGRVEPLSAARYGVAFTIDAEARDDLERLRDLMSHRNPSGDLGVIFKAANKLLIAQLEKELRGKTTRTPPKTRGTKKGTISREARRAAFARDGAQCTYHDPHGNRCPATARLELDHVKPRAHGGSDDAENLRVTCRAHNLMYAEQTLGTKARDFRQRKSPPAPPPANPSAVTPVDAATIERARSGLVDDLRFHDRDVRRALDLVSARYAASNLPPPPIEGIVRDALAVLT
jgi:hypothetical protein